MSVILKVFWRAMHREKRLLFIGALCSLLLATCWVVEPLYARFAIDRLTTQGLDVSAWQFFGYWALIFLVMNVTSGLNTYYRWRVVNVLIARVREIYYDHLLRLDIRYHVQARAGELMKTIDNAADAMETLTKQTLMELPTSFLTASAFYIISFFINWRLALIAVVMIPIYLVIVGLTVWWTRKHGERIHMKWLQAMGRGYDAMSNIFTVKSNAKEESELERMSVLHRQAVEEWNRVNRMWAVLEGFGYFGILRLAMIGTGIWLLAEGRMTLGSLFFFQFSFFRLIVPFEMLSNMMPRWNDLLAKVRKAEDFYNKEIDIESGPNAKILPDLKGHIELRNVSFSYGDSEAISGITLDVQAGEHIAFVGHSGAGKSTLALLLNRFYDPTDGSIFVDGVDMKDLDVQWWRSQVGLVLQENITFNDSIGDNIRYARPDATMADIKDAATRASADAFIERFPKGYDTLVGERGIRLSGGERQRVAIARAILKKPQIVVLDEATSALDSITEREVQEGIRELIQGRTSFIIAHRLSTVRAVNRIAVLEKGRLIACAPHEELMRTCDIYRKMVELQHQGILAE